MSKKKKKSSEELKPINPPYEKCLNCGAELKGKYCYACGQEAIGKVPSIWKFIMVYITIRSCGTPVSSAHSNSWC